MTRCICVRRWDFFWHPRERARVKSGRNANVQVWKVTNDYRLIQRFAQLCHKIMLTHTCVHYTSCETMIHRELSDDPIEINRRDEGWPDGPKAFVHSTLGTKRVHWNSNEKLGERIRRGKGVRFERERHEWCKGDVATWQPHKLKFSSLSLSLWFASKLDLNLESWWWLKPSCDYWGTQGLSTHGWINLWINLFKLNLRRSFLLCIFPDYVRYFCFQVLALRLIQFRTFTQFITITRY